MIAPDDERRPEPMSRRAPVELVTPELLARHDRPGPRYTSYPTAIEFHGGYGEAEYRRGLEAATNARPIRSRSTCTSPSAASAAPSAGATS